MSRRMQTQDCEAKASSSMKSQVRLPMMGSSGTKRQLPPQAGWRKCSQTAQTSTKHPADTMTPWSGLSLSQSSFNSISPPPPAPVLAPPSPHLCHRTGGVAVRRPVPSPPDTVPAEGGRAVRVRHRVTPQTRLPRTPRFPPLRPVTNLSFSRSFTFSFFELPLHHSPRSRSERIRDLLLLWKQIQY
ncbi:hypothetical protein DPEC_G00001680 [Dallia pectoralis]|uniref:Uncharacterized protein n=1 Tax=Dallia pectoralis TaxID=75939 RepID=A0ACC2HIY3_DALPE|nr:hypothetical protein DPEC_G00001680 [Dallia pectoralis]